jgi:hypothetical protein
MLNKDQSIITQVAAKIAADLTVGKGEYTMSEWADCFEFVQETLFNAHGFTDTANVAETSMTEAFGSVEPVSRPVIPMNTNAGGNVRVKGTQHGPLPEWLIAEASKAGVTEVWDNRDKLSENPKRPWFKAVNGDKAFWQPRGR